MKVKRTEPLGVFFGADPEFFLMKEGKVVSAHHFFPSKKEAETAAFRAAERGQMPPRTPTLRDGAALELNPHPRTCKGLFLLEMRRSILEALTRLAPGVEIVPISGAALEQEDFEKGPSDVREGGCDPALNAYENAPPRLNYSTQPGRMAGGHLHFSSGGTTGAILTNPATYRDIVRLLDVYLGLPYRFIFGDWPGVEARGLAYGRPGEYRIQNYSGTPGLEYRSLGPEIFIHPGLLSMFLGIARWVIANTSAIYFRNVYYSHGVAAWPSMADLRKQLRTVPGHYDLPVLVAIKKWVDTRKGQPFPVQELQTTWESWGRGDWGVERFCELVGVEQPDQEPLFQKGEVRWSN